MADSGSSLAAALARDVQGEALDEIIAAARERLRLSKIPCETCQGEGTVIKTKTFAGIGLMASGVECPSCGGSGEVYPSELVEVVARAAFDHVYPDADDLWADPEEAALVARFSDEARAVLDALDLYAKEATK